MSSGKLLPPDDDWLERDNLKDCTGGEIRRQDIRTKIG